MDFAAWIEQAVRVDWKEGAEEALYALREGYRALCPALDDAAFDALAENYAAEDTLDHLKATGQELTQFGFLLYHVEEDADAYPLVLLAEGEAAEFEAWCKKQKKKLHKLTQPRRRPGMPARRLDLGERLPCESCEMPEGWRIRWDWDGPADDTLWVSSRSDSQRFRDALLRLDAMPLQPGPVTPLMPAAVARREDGHWAAVLRHPQRMAWNSQWILKDKTSRLCVGRELEDMERWRVLDTREGLEHWTELFWFGEDLFVADPFRAAVIRRAARGGPLQLLLEKEDPRTFPRFFPRFFVRGGALYLYWQRRVYRWREKKLFSKAGFAPIYTVPDEIAQGFFPVGERETAFISHRWQAPRGTTEAKLVILDVESGGARSLPCRLGELQGWQGRLCVIPHNVRRGEPILQCFDLNSGERRELLLGALGKCEIYGLRALGDGRTVLQVNDGTVRFSDCLWEFMKPVKEEG